jgi:hypothetical protein
MIIRNSPRRSFTALPNAIFRDRRLSLDTKGLLAYLLSLPSNWEIRPHLIAKALSPQGGRPIGRERLQRMFAELIAAGYMAKSNGQSHRDGGYWGPFTYIVGADPAAVEEEAIAQAVTFLPQLVLPSTAEPSTTHPSAANPHTEKRKKDTNYLKLQTARLEFQYGDAAITEGRLSGQPNKGAQTRGRVLNGDRGRIELQVAQRLGPDGFELLMELTAAEVDQLCALQRRGRLDDAALERLRSKVALSRQKGLA